MANVLQDGFMTLDTTGVIIPKGSSVTVTRIHFFPAAADDEILVEDAGNVKEALRDKAIAATPVGDLVRSFNAEERMVLDGLSLTTLTAGTVRIWHRS